MKYIAVHNDQERVYTHRELSPLHDWVYYFHDCQIPGGWDGDKQKEFRNRLYAKKGGRPETLPAYEKEIRVVLDDAWQTFAWQLAQLCCYGEIRDQNEIPPLEFARLSAAFDSLYASNRVINNKKEWWRGYMTLAMGGNYGKKLGESKPDRKFGKAYVIECLNASEPPPDVEDVFYNQQHLWSKATNLRYAHPRDNIQGLDNPYQHVTPFPQYDEWNAHAGLMTISNTGTMQIQQYRCVIINDGMISEPYKPALPKAFV